MNDQQRAVMQMVQPQGEPVAVLNGDDEYGPILKWYKHWSELPIGAKFYTSPPSIDPRLTLTCPICAGTLMESVDAQIEAMRVETLEKAAKVCEESTYSDEGDYWAECMAERIRSMK